MNPPTPPTQYQYQDENVYTPAATYGALEPGREALTPTNGNAKRSSRPSSFIGSGGKSRFYGDLRVSMGSIGTEHRKNSETNVHVIQIHNDSDSDDGYERTKTMQSVDASDYSGNIEVYGSEDDSDSNDEGGSQLNVQHLRFQHNKTESAYPPITTNSVRVDVHQPSPVAASTKPEGNWNGVRQISNSTGNDLHSGYAGLGAEFGRGMARRREVSGKVVEEGRGGVVVEELQEVEVTPKKKGLGSSGMGWARFKGL